VAGEERVIVAVRGGAGEGGDHARMAMVGVRPVALHGDLHQAGGERGRADRRRRTRQAAPQAESSSRPRPSSSPTGNSSEVRNKASLVASAVAENWRTASAVEGVDRARLVGGAPRW
jgi:hypothetical protein